MTVIVAGGTGFLGQALQAHLERAGHRVRALTRRQTTPGDRAVSWEPDGTVGSWSEAIDGSDAVVNLAGAGIADARWTDARKRVLRESRLRSTRSLVLAIQRAARPPAVFVSASGTGYYGDCGAEIVTEDTPPGEDFLAQLCVDWEREAQDAAGRTRLVVLRSGVVLDKAGGALPRMLLPFRLGLGGPLGSGTQYLPWIHIADWLALVSETLSNPDARGTFNATAPSPATNTRFTRAFGRALRRPAFIRVPSFALRTALGELADTLLTGQRAVPKRAEQLGFTFRFGDIEPALEDLLA